MLNLMKELSVPQGLVKNVWYEAVVVDNNDPKKLCRVTARIHGIFNGIADNHLPWCIPGCLCHADGASATSGTVDIPKPGTKVRILFQEGNSELPIYFPYMVDTSTVLDEAVLNYPDRKVHRLQNNALIVIDTHTNEVFIRNPGAINIFVEGDANISVSGNMVEKIFGNKTTFVQGDLTEIVHGNRKLGVAGTDLATCIGQRDVHTGGDDNHFASGNVLRTSPYINDDVPQSVNAPVPEVPVLPKWPGIRGNVPS